MIARIRIVIDVPFDFTIEPPDESGHSPSQVEAAQYADTTILNEVKTAVTTTTDGTILDELCLVEEVRQ